MKKFFHLYPIIVVLGLCLVLLSYCATRSKKISPSSVTYHLENSDPMNNGEAYPSLGASKSLSTAVRPIVIYKTRENYQRFVPVQLSEDKKQVVSYPGRADIYYGNELATPIEIGKGYLMDRRGINENSAFLDLTYEQYAQLSDAPDTSFIMEHLMDTDPLIYLAVIDSRTVDANDLQRIALLVEEGNPQVSVILDKRNEVN